MAEQQEQQSWVDQVQSVEQSLVDVISLDGDLVVEALSNIPSDARGRLRTMLVLADEVVVQAAHGYQIVIDTGLGTAGWYVQEDPVQAADTADPQPEPSAARTQSWADTVDTDGVPVLALQSAPGPQPAPDTTQVQQEPLPTADSGPAATQAVAPAVAPAQVQTATQVQTDTQVQQQTTAQPVPRPILGPLSKAATRGQQMAPQQMVAHITVKAQPKLQPQPQPQIQQQLVPVKSSPAQPDQMATVHPGQPAAKAPTVPPPPAAKGHKGRGPGAGHSKAAGTSAKTAGGRPPLSARPGGPRGFS